MLVKATIDRGLLTPLMEEKLSKVNGGVKTSKWMLLQDMEPLSISKWFMLPEVNGHNKIKLVTNLLK